MSETESVDAGGDSPTPDDVTFDTVNYEALPADQWTPEAAAKWRQKMAAEHKAYRERWSPYEQVFKEFEDNDREVLLRAISALREDPEQAFAFWVRNAVQAFGPEFLKNFLPEETQMSDTPTTPTEQADQKPAEPVPSAPTPEDIEKLVQERINEQVALMEAKFQINRELESLGYKPGSKDAEVLCFLAAKYYEGDLAKAHEAVVEELGKVVPQQQAKSAEAPKPQMGQPPSGAQSLEGMSKKEKLEAIASKFFPSG